MLIEQWAKEDLPAMAKLVLRALRP